MKTTSSLILSLAITIIALPSLSYSDPRCKSCPYSCADLGLGRKDCSFISEAAGICCVDLTKEGMEIAIERDRVIPTATPESCPPGFFPRDNRCSDSERKHGCRDVRLNSGLGCVKK